MDIDLLIESVDSKQKLAEIGNKFFSDASRTKDDTRKFFTQLLEKKDYESLAAVVCLGRVEEGSCGSASASEKKMLRVSDRCFKDFMTLVEDAEVDTELVFPMLFEAFDAPKNGFLYSFVGGIDAYFKSLAVSNYDAAAYAIYRFDKKYKCLSALINADRHRTMERILNDLLYGTNVNKQLLRKRLLEERVDIVPDLCREYIGAKIKTKEGIVRLLLLYKTDSRANAFLDKIYFENESVVISRLIAADRTARPRRAEKVAHDGCNIDTIKVDGVLYELKPTDSLDVLVVPTPYPSEVIGAVAALRKRIDNTVSELKDDMINNLRIPSEQFVARLNKDAVFAAVASTLLFSVYKDGVMSDVIIVEGGKLHDLNNNQIGIPDRLVAVSHPIEWGEYAFLKCLSVWQPFEQIARDSYFPSETDIAHNCCRRMNNRIVQSKELKASFAKEGFRLLSKNRYNESSSAGITRNGIMCVLDFTPTDFTKANEVVFIKDIWFYRYSDVVKLGGQFYTDGISPMSIKDIPAIDFSEFIYSVNTVLGARKIEC